MIHSGVLEHFVVFEGIDGSGTTTQLNRIVEFCTHNNIKAFSTREPTSSSIGNVIDLFLKNKISLAPQTVVRLFATDRCEHIYGSSGVIEMLEEGLVISDRYLFSSLAYQGATDEYGLALTENLAFPLPQVLFFFELPVEVAMQRIESRSKVKEFYEKKEFLKKVQKNYLTIMEDYQKNYPKMKIIRVDAKLSEDEVFNKIKDAMEKLGLFTSKRY